MFSLYIYIYKSRETERQDVYIYISISLSYLITYIVAGQGHHQPTPHSPARVRTYKYCTSLRPGTWTTLCGVVRMRLGGFLGVVVGVVVVVVADESPKLKTYRVRIRLLLSAQPTHVTNRVSIVCAASRLAGILFSCIVGKLNGCKRDSEMWTLLSWDVYNSHTVRSSKPWRAGPIETFVTAKDTTPPEARNPTPTELVAHLSLTSKENTV